MRKFLAAALIAVLAFFAVPASPAHADTVHGCSDYSIGSLGSICIFNGTDFGKYEWHQFDMSYIINQPNDCAQFPGGPSGIINEVSSFVINPGSNSASMLGYKVRFWPNDYCTGTPVPWYWADEVSYDADLRYTAWGNVSNVWNSVSIAP